MIDPVVLSELAAFAREKIAADRYPLDYHFFNPARCPNCGVVPLRLIIEHHTGSKKGNFRGLILARCSKCGAENRIFSFTGQQREPLRQEQPVCTCGHEEFVVGECERFEREEGGPGFFDEGVVVGQCATCGRKRVFVFTD